MKFLRLLLVLLAILAGCSGVPELEKTVHVDEVTIKWVRGIEANCGGAKSPEGCATPTATGCTITMPEDARDLIVAHEFRHCFKYRHK